MKNRPNKPVTTRRWSRRAFLGRAAAATLALPVAFGPLAACGPFRGSAGNEGGTAAESEEGAVGKGDITLGVAMINLSIPFFVRMQEAGTEATKDYGVRTVWRSAEDSLENQLSVVENFIQQQVDVILVNAVDDQGILPAIDRAQEAEIPVVVMSNYVEHPWSYNTLYPDYENLATQARILATALDGEGQVGFLFGSPGNSVSETRRDGFVETMKDEFPGIEVVSVQPTNYDPAEARSVTETMLTTYPDLAGLGFESDPLGLAAIDAANAAGKDDLLYVGNDGDPEMHPMLKEGSMLSDCLTGAGRVGYWNVAVGTRLARGEELDKELFLPTYFVMSDETAAMLSNKGLDIDYVTPAGD